MFRQQNPAPTGPGAGTGGQGGDGAAGSGGGAPSGGQGGTEGGQGGSSGGSGPGNGQSGSQGANGGQGGGQGGQGGAGGSGTGGQGDQRPPWEREGVPFDAERAWQLVQNTRAERDSFKGRAETAEGKVSETERANMSAQQQAETDRDSFKGRAEKAEAALARHEVAAEKGIPANAVAFLQGSTKEELAASADALLPLLGQGGGAPAGSQVPPGGRPQERLGAPPAGGRDPNAGSIELDPDKLAGQVPRGF